MQTATARCEEAKPADARDKTQAEVVRFDGLALDTLSQNRRLQHTRITLRTIEQHL